jgi:hypothetical protein
VNGNLCRFKNSYQYGEVGVGEQKMSGGNGSWSTLIARSRVRVIANLRGDTITDLVRARNIWKVVIFA